MTCRSAPRPSCAISTCSVSAPRAFHALVLAATARTATAAARAVADRRAGRDASAQEALRDAAADLQVLRDDLTGAAVQLRLRAATPPPADPEAQAFQAFETHVLLADVARALGTAHQKLLSLYPLVSADLVEDTRLLARDAAHADPSSAGDIAARLVAWCSLADGAA